MSEDVETRPAVGWQGFWERGTWWKALLAAVGYLVLYEGSSLLIGLLGRSHVQADPLADAASVLLSLVAPLLVGAVVLVASVGSLGWFPALFGRQPIRGRGWMWVAVVVTVIPIVLRLLGIDYGRFAGGVVALVFVAGLLIGFTEELLTRGIAVKILREAGHGERVVAVVSSALFALLHSVNLFTGQALVTVLVTLVYTFGFGMMMYLVLRVTRSLVWPMVIHGLTDPTTILATGGIDVNNGAPVNALLSLAGPFSILFVVVALVALLFIRGRVGQDDERADGERR